MSTTIDDQGNIYINPPIICTDCGKPGNKYTILCDDCEDSAWTN